MRFSGQVGSRYVPGTHDHSRRFPTPCNAKASLVSFGGGRGLFQRLVTQLGACHAMAEDVGCLRFHGAGLGWGMVGDGGKERGNNG